MEAQRQCPVTFTFRVTGGRFKAKIILVLLRQESLRYSEVRKAWPPISEGCSDLARRRGHSQSALLAVDEPRAVRRRGARSKI